MISRILFVSLSLISGFSFAEITATYQGTISSDTGLGFLNQTMSLDITYDETTAFDTVDNTNNFSTYVDAITSATLSIGTNTWSLDATPTTNSTMVTNDMPANIISPVTDSFFVSLIGFSGPDLGTGITTETFSFQFVLSDVEPNGAPDGLMDHTTLPTTAPNPDLFQPNATSLPNRIRLFWNVGSGEESEFYEIVAETITMDGDGVQVPLPLWVSTVLALLLFIRVINIRRQSLS